MSTSVSVQEAPATPRRLPTARIILAALVLAGGLLTALAATGADRETATAPAASPVSGSMAAPRLAIAGVYAGNAERPPNGYLHIVDTRRGPTVVIDLPTGLANPYIVRGPDPNRLFVLATDLRAIDTTTGDTIWQTPASGPGVTMGGFTPPPLAASADGRLLFLHSQQSPFANSTPDQLTAWIDVLDAATGERLTDAIALPDTCNLVHLLPNARDTSLWVFCEWNPQQWYRITLDTTADPIQATVTSPNLDMGLPGRGMAAALSLDGSQLLILNDLLHVNVIDADTASERDRITLLAEDEQGRWQAMNAALTPDGTQLYVGIRAITSDVSGFRQDLDRPAEVRVYDTTSWDEAERVTLEHRLMSVPIAFSADGSSAYLIEYIFEDDAREPSGSQIITITPDATEPTVLITRPGENLRYIVPLTP